MTINVAVVTSEALVLGCDSIASVTGYFVDPFEKAEQLPNGKLRLEIGPEDITQQVTNAWDGVTKMFAIHGSKVPVGAVTAGLAKLRGRSTNSYATEFLTDFGGSDSRLTTVSEVAEEFLKFIRGCYDEHYKDSPIPEEYRDGPLFLVGGYSKKEHLPSLYRINVQKNTVTEQYKAGKFGIAWEGQADAVERLIRGYDSDVRSSIEQSVAQVVEEIRRSLATEVAGILQRIVDQGGRRLPEGVVAELPQPPEIKLPWDRFHSPISYGNLPVQDAVDFAAYLVSLQSGKAKFASGVATVGGRTHIGVITKSLGFRMLDEPELRHRNIGFV